MKPVADEQARPTMVIEATATSLAISEVARQLGDRACDYVEIAAALGQAALDFGEVSAVLATHKLRCAGLALDASLTKLGSSDAGARSKARERIAEAVHDAARFGASYVRLVAAQLDAPDAPRYSDASHHVLDALLALRHEAGLCGVRIVINLADHGFLISPIEARQFLDAVNSPWVGGSIYLDRCISTASATDWIETLTHRLTVVRVGDTQDSSLDLTAIGRVFAAERFGGFVVSPVTLLEKSWRALAPVNCQLR